MKLYLLLILFFVTLLNAQNLEHIKLQLQWKHQFEFAGFYAAKEEGYYKDAGLDVDFLEYEGKTDIVKSVVNKKADFGLTYSSLIAEYLKGSDVVFVANYFKQSPLVIVTQKEIKNLAMLKGKKVMGVNDNIDNITLKLMLEKFGISLNEVTNIPTTYSVNQFADKKVDAMALFTTNEIYELDKLGVKYNVFNPSLYGEEYYDLNLFTSKELASKNPHLVQKFKEASDKGWKYALNHKEELVKLIQKKYNSQHKTKEALLFEARQIEQLMFTKTEKIGDIDPLRVTLIAKNFVESGYVESSNLTKLANFIFHAPHNTQHATDTKKTTLQLTSDEKKWLDKNKMIKIASLSSWPKNEKGQNIHTAYLNLLRKYGNIDIYNVEFDSWNEAYKNTINNDFIHGILYLSWSKERSEKYFNYLPPYNFVPVNLVVKKNDYSIKSLKDLNNSSVYTLKKSISNNIIKESGLSIKTIQLESGETLIKALAAPHPKARAIVTFNYSPNRFKDNNLKIVKRIHNKYGNVHIGVSKNQKIAYSILKKAHENISKDKLVEIQNQQFIQKNSQFIQQLNTEERAYLTKKSNITMCVDPDWEPYEKIDKDGNHIGLVADYIKLIEKKIDKKIELIKTTTWEESLKFAKSGKCEILSFLNQTQNRDKFLDYTPVIYSEPHVIVTKDNVTYLDGIAAVEGQTVGLVKGYSSDEYISRNYPKVKIQYIKNYEEGMKLVSEGKLYATINSLLSTAYLIKKLNLVNIKIAGKTELLNSYKIGVIKDEPLLLSILAKAVSTITEQEKDKIFSNWISVKFEQGYDYEIFWKVFSIIFVGILLLLYRQYTIKKINKKLHKKVKEQVSKIVEKDRMIFHQNKLVAMGEMIENIAHQWRQPLSQINSAVLILDDIAHENKIDDARFENKLNEIETLTMYLSKTISDFQDFYHPNKKREYFNLESVIEDSIGIIGATFKKNNIAVTMKGNCDKDYYGFKNELMQVIIVILNNAKDALLLNKIANPHINILLGMKDQRVTIEIYDNAGGIDETIMERIFEPYFSTKHKTKGRGLGLYISKVIVEESMNGELVALNYKKGACFRIFLKEDNE